MSMYGYWDTTNLTSETVAAFQPELTVLAKWDNETQIEEVASGAGNTDTDASSATGGSKIVIDDDATFSAILTYIAGAVNLFAEPTEPANRTAFRDPAITARLSSYIDNLGNPVTGRTFVDIDDLVVSAGITTPVGQYGYSYSASSDSDYTKLALRVQKSFSRVLFFTDAGDTTSNRNSTLEDLINRCDSGPMRELIANAIDEDTADITTKVTLSNVTYVYECNDHAANVALFDAFNNYVLKKKK